MALTLDAIYTPLNDFFLKLYAAPEESGVAFRFDKLGSVISDADFLDPNHPELGYSQSLARERFSDLVNHVPVDAGDGANLVFRIDAVDDTYYHLLLSPAIPRTDEDDANSENLIEAFSRLKADALKRWTDTTLASSTGLMLEFKPSLATPGNWYDKNAADVWTSQSFSISSPQQQGGNTPPANPGAGTFRPIWRIRASDQEIQHVMPTARLQLSPALLHAISDTVSPTASASPTSASETVTSRSPATLVSSPAVATVEPSARFVRSTDADHSLVRANPTFAVYNHFRDGLSNTPLSDRLKIAQILDEAAPTQPAATDSIQASFSYTLVRIARPWLLDAFLQSNAWYVPATPRGAAFNNTCALETIAFVVIKDLVIEATWAAADISAAAGASDFGPFKIEQGIVNNKVNHAGIQVIGWLVQSLPILPPNDPPA